ncbi:PEGA domain-containing protein [Methanospirillum hungatei]|uniref:PEGA domain-containing protein n=1 Tax=Methanospirillum hungatei TaxID=2203 RepID=UPI0026F2501A|nr:PEGA domain-containing protein [Methanospirillum hungatei]
MVSAASDDEDGIDWFKYYLDHYLGYGSPWYYTGLHAPTFDYSDMFKTPTISNIQDLLKPSGSDTNIGQSNYYQNTGFLITSSPPGADVYVNGEFKGKTRTLNSLKVFGLEFGTYELVIRYPGYSDYNRSFTLFHNEVLSIKAVLKPLEKTTG